VTERTEAELQDMQLEIAVAALARIGFLNCRYPNRPPEYTARKAMLNISNLQTEIEGIRDTPP
jgi:hypothetical protein